MDKKLVVAHRGASAEVQENTIEAFQRAIELGADMVELDVRKTADAALVTFHDADIGGKKISDLSFAEAQALAKHQNFAIPTLEQSLKFIAGKIPVQIELKGLGYEKQAAELALAILKTQDFYIISFYFSSLNLIRRLRRQIRTGLILGGSRNRMLRSLWYLFRRKSMTPYLDSVCINWRLWQRGWADKFPGRLPVFVWTVDDDALFKLIAKDRRVAGIATNAVRQMVTLNQTSN